MIQKQSYQIKGMRQDNLIATGYSKQFAHEIMNMRFNTIGDYTTTSWTTEKGTKKVNIIKDELAWFDDYGYTNYSLDNFEPIGQAVINDYWILFGIINDADFILRFRYINEDLGGTILYKGKLDFNKEYPLETLTFYENESIQKVYWTDGINQPRVINIKPTKVYEEQYTTQFDFVQEVSLREEVDIIKDQSGNGIFPPCTVKYAITYYKQYGQETNIVYDSPLYYPIIGDRACSPDEISGDSFIITVTNLDKEHGFDYIRLYSIIRTSENATPIVKIVKDIKLTDQILDEDKVVFIDTNTTGEIIDPTILNYVGGRNITAETFDQKDNTLFLGNITLKTESIHDVVDVNTAIISSDFVLDSSDYHKIIPATKSSTTSSSPFTPTTPGGNIQVGDNINRTGFYDYQNQLNQCKVYNTTNLIFDFKANSHNIKTFKTDEYYRFGIQFQDKFGVWSDVVYIKDCQNTILPKSHSDYYNVPYMKTVLASDTVQQLVDKGYKKTRLVCCYPTNADRSVIAQGVICPTVRNKRFEVDNVPTFMASWFFRNKYNDFTQEIQCASNDESDDAYFSNSLNYYTFNSPDVEFDESLRTLDTRAFRINQCLGDMPVRTCVHSTYLDATGPTLNSINFKNIGLSQALKIVDNNTSINNHYPDQDSLNYGKNVPIWNDCNVYYQRDGNSKTQYYIYPFQRNVLNNYIKDFTWTVNDGKGKIERTFTKDSVISSKVMAYLSFVRGTNYLKDQACTGNNMQFVDSTEVVPTLFGNDVYYGNVNTIVPLNTGSGTSTDFLIKETIPSEYDNKTKIVLSGVYTIKHKAGEWSKYSENEEDLDSNLVVPCADPVSLTYKSTPHIVFTGTFDPDVANYYHLADITRTINDSQRFNGDPTNSIYIPCGPAVPLITQMPTVLPDHMDRNGNIIVRGYEGDHYLMRYDCLKTYPFSTEDINQVVEILSYVCETRINLDGRYDKKRGLIDNTTVLPSNFNLINKSYTQSNNFFSYMVLDDDISKLNNFNNQITWTNTKVSGEDIDTWTNITLASTADADGTLGSITKILKQKDDLILFQEHGIAQIGFNQTTIIPTENNIPLELAKTGKYTGLKYASTTVGCQNKWSISNTKNGIFFIDDSRQEIVSFDEKFTSLSTTYGFDAYMIQQLPKQFIKWNPNTFNNFVTYYDKLSNDVYYINKNICLAWNEQSGSFTSFYNYENTPYITNLGNHSLMWHNGIWTAREGDKYSSFFDSTKPYWMTIVCDGLIDEGSSFPADKVFNTIEYRADMFNPNGLNSVINEPLFNKKAAWNGYQMYKEFDIDAIRKFNTWRIQLPRATYEINGVLTTTRDRIRNPFCYIKLLNDDVNTTNRMILHDLAVTFDIR